jgi:hypothetical protein
MTPLAGQPIPSRATTIRLSKPGFLAHRRRLPAGQGAVRLKTVVLQPKPRAQRPPPAATVRLRVAAAYNGDPVRNAPVLVDGKAWGRTPLQRDVEPGTYKVRVVAAGYRPAEKRVRVAAGKKTVLVILDLTR